MLQGEETFKFSVYPHQVFTLEKVLYENKISFVNEKTFGIYSRSLKYYIKNKERAQLDLLCKQHKLELLVDSIPSIETRFSKLNITFPIVLLVVFFIILFFSIL